MLTIRIRAEYDPEASVWVGQSDDIPLVTEAETVDALKPALLRSIDSSDFLYLLMPVRVS